MAKATEKANEVKATEATAIKIETGIAIPQKSSGKTAKFPFDSLEIGQSFFTTETAKKINSLTAAYNGKYSKKSETETKIWKGKTIPATIAERKFICRTVTENNVTGCRVWRIEPDNK